ncbi:hypothetical protein BpHYR1_041472 [Brachionus plicatilis]|uniref:Uncharacterized protein n=1 Tax=Brachionus plicatilis TaxID=10195 RepID=A0A3M7PZ55_BRAPC|nr:hypothetical protein BpHYR1_041472 [Brachionus plicatilis]
MDSSKLNDHIVEVLLHILGQQMDSDRLTTGRLAKQCDLVRIAIEGLYVVFDPIDCHSLVQNAEISIGLIGFKTRDQKSQGPNSVLDCDKDTIA